jgi:hypothetical protein
VKYKVFDNWSGKPVASGLSYLEAKKFVEQNEPPFNARAGIRYGYWPESSPSLPNGERS